MHECIAALTLHADSVIIIIIIVITAPTPHADFAIIVITAIISHADLAIVTAITVAIAITGTIPEASLPTRPCG